MPIDAAQPRCLGCYRRLDQPERQMHAHCARRLFGQPEVPRLGILKYELERSAHDFLSKGVAVTGVQPKLSLHLASQPGDRFTVVGALGGNYILKPQSVSFAQLPELEDLTMHMAAAIGIETALHGLILSEDGELAYITKRFDRANGRKVAQEDACQLSELPTEQKYRSSHEKLGKVLRRYSSFPGDDMLRLFELTAFCYLTGNADMHLKNFSLSRNPQGRYRMTPAYDLVPTRLVISARDDPEELALNLGGKKSRFKPQDFSQYAQYLQIPNRVVARTWKAWEKRLPELMWWIHHSFLENETKDSYQQLIQSRWSVLSRS